MPTCSEVFTIIKDAYQGDKRWFIKEELKYIESYLLAPHRINQAFQIQGNNNLDWIIDWFTGQAFFTEKRRLKARETINTLIEKFIVDETKLPLLDGQLYRNSFPNDDGKFIKIMLRNQSLITEEYMKLISQSHGTNYDHRVKMAIALDVLQKKEILNDNIIIWLNDSNIAGTIVELKLFSEKVQHLFSQDLLTEPNVEQLKNPTNRPLLLQKKKFHRLFMNIPLTQDLLDGIFKCCANASTDSIGYVMEELALIPVNDLFRWHRDKNDTSHRIMTGEEILYWLNSYYNWKKGYVRTLTGIDSWNMQKVKNYLEKHLNDDFAKDIHLAAELMKIIAPVLYNLHKAKAWNGSVTYQALMRCCFEPNLLYAPDGAIAMGLTNEKVGRYNGITNDEQWVDFFLFRRKSKNELESIAFGLSELKNRGISVTLQIKMLFSVVKPVTNILLILHDYQLLNEKNIMQLLKFALRDALSPVNDFKIDFRMVNLFLILDASVNKKTLSVPITQKVLDIILAPPNDALLCDVSFFKNNVLTENIYSSLFKLAAYTQLDFERDKTNELLIPVQKNAFSISDIHGILMRATAYDKNQSHKTPTIYNRKYTEEDNLNKDGLEGNGNYFL